MHFHYWLKESQQLHPSVDSVTVHMPCYPQITHSLEKRALQICADQLLHLLLQAGRPKTITGFQTHTTPVLLSVGERAELGTQKYLPVTPVLEGIVILKPNPEYVDTAD